MPFLELAPQVSFCLVDGAPVFLDLSRDRYLRLQGDSASAFLEAMNRDGRAVWSNPAVERLVASGLVALSPRPGCLKAACAPVAEASVMEDSVSGMHSSILLLPELAIDLLKIRIRLERGSLPSLVEEHRTEKARARISPDDVKELAKAYLATRRLVPAAPNCLRDSLAMSIFLRRRGQSASLVFGVKGAPFGAHCWLQCGTTVLNDSLGNARDFTPVLVA